MTRAVRDVGRIHTRSARTFFDANILIYADDSSNPVKQAKAVELIVEHARQRTAVISLQVLGEYFHAVTRKLHLNSKIARSQAEFYSRWHLVQPVLSDVFSAMEIHQLHKFSYWDCLILQCAVQSRCTVLLTEDLHNGQEIRGVKIVNPFK